MFRLNLARYTLSILVLILLLGVAAAQDLLPIPPVDPNSNAVSVDSSGDLSSLRNSTRDSNLMWIYRTWSAINPNLPWNASDIAYSLTDFGPSGTAIFADYNTSRGYCSISIDSSSITCNLGSSIPGNVVVSVGLLISLDPGVDWFELEAFNGYADYWYTYHIWDPSAYASNSVADSSFESSAIPGWTLAGPAKRLCNNDRRTVSYEGDCALQVKSTLGKARLRLNLSEVYYTGDVIYVDWASQSKNLATNPKLIVISTSLGGQKYKSVWRIPNGTDPYTGWFVNKQIPVASQRVDVRIVGGVSGKLLVDTVDVFVVHYSDLY